MIREMYISRAIKSMLNRPLLTASMLGLFTLFIFLPAASYDFVNWDDNGYVYDNPAVLGGLSLRGAQHAFTHAAVGHWAPLTILSYQLDATLFGPGPAGFHCTNIMLHSAAVALLWIALAGMTGCPGLSAAATLLFAVHPLRVESVAWVSERKDVLSLFFLALSLLAYERYCRSPCPRRFLTLVTAVLAGLLSKATLVTLPVLLMLLDVWPLGRITVPGLGCPTRCDGVVSPYASRSWGMLLAEKMPLLVISLIFSVITVQAQGNAGCIDTDMTFWETRLPNAVYAVAMHGLNTLYPLYLQPVYLHPGVSGTPFGLLLGSAAFIIACIGLAVACARRVPAVPVGLAWFLVSLLPSLGVVAQQGIQSHADRHTYVPHIGLCVAMVWGVAELAKRLRLPAWILPTALTAVVAALVMLDQWQLSHWRNGINLWSHAIAIDPSNPFAQCKLANALRDIGQFDAAESHYRRALKAEPTYITASNNLAVLLVNRGKIDEARQHLQQRRDSKQSDTEPLLQLSFLLLNAGKAAEAMEATREAIEITPTDARAYFLHGRALANQDLMEPAIESYQRALELDLENIQIRNDLATLLTRQKRYDEAIPLYRSIIERDPAADVPRRNLARALEEQARNAQQESQSSP